MVIVMLRNFILNRIVIVEKKSNLKWKCCSILDITPRMMNGKMVKFMILMHKEWSSEVWMTKDNLLKVKGYFLFKFISQTKTLKRI